MSDEVRGPVVAGAIWPVILAPRAFVRLGEDEQRAALLHEVAHVVRRDFAINLLCEAAAAPIAWHPVSHEIKAGVRRSRELACDAMASASMASADAYARCLLSLAKTLHAPVEGSAVLVGLIGRGDLEERLMHLITGPRRGGPSRLLIAGAAAAAILAPAALLHVSPAFAQEVPPPPPPPPVEAAAPPAPPAAPAPPSEGPRHAYVRHGQFRARSHTPDLAPAEPAATVDEPIVDEAHIQEVVRHAVEQARVAASAMAQAEVQRAMASAEVRRAMAQARVHEGEMTLAEREQIHQAAREAAEAWKNAHVEETLAEVRREMNSPEVRHAMHDAGRMHIEPPIPPIPPVPPAPPPPPQY
jgi:hypothetical protein